MEINVHVHLHGDSSLAAAIAEMGSKLAGALDALKEQVAKNTTVTQSAVTLIGGIAQRITDAGTDPAKLQALTQELQASDEALAAAVAANTVAEPAVQPPPPAV